MNEVTLEYSLYCKTKHCMCITTYFSLFFGCFWWPESLCIFTYKFQFADLMKMHFLVSSFLSAICQITSWRVYQTDFLTAFPSWHICKWVSYLTKEIIGQKQMIILKIYFLKAQPSSLKHHEVFQLVSANLNWSRRCYLMYFLCFG